MNDGSRDGRLVVVDTSGTRCHSAANVAPTLQQALDDWERCEPRLRALAVELERTGVAAEPLDPRHLLAPLPRAFEWIDGSAYLNHVRLARRARGAEVPATLESDPLVYQGGSGVLLGPRAPAVLPDPAWGLDFEGEVCVVLGDVPRAPSSSQTADAVRLISIANDLSYRNLIPGELAKGFGFFNSKPATAFAGFAVTPDELGPAWHGGRLHLPLRCTLNGQVVGTPNAGVGMYFSFYDLIAHITKTRAFTAGTILGSGTVSNEDRSLGVACLAEQRCLELLERGAPSTRFLEPGDRVRIEVLAADGRDIFCAIEQEVVAA
jgi:fumarylacetoacetate (FAA) hydrolase